MASLVKNGKNYGLIWSENGRQTRESLKTDNKAKAKRKKAELETKYYEGEHDPFKRKWYEQSRLTADISLKEAVEEFILEKTKARGKKGWGDTQAKNEKWFMRMFADFFEGNLLTHLDSDDLESFYYREGINSDHSRNSNAISVQTFLNWCVGKGYLEEKPTYELKKPQTKIPKFLYLEELAELIKHRGLDWVSLGWIVLAGTGMRPDELSHLKSMHLERNAILIGEDFTTKVRAERRIPLLFGVERALEQLQKEPSEYLLGRKPSHTKRKLSRQFTAGWRAVHSDKPKRTLYNLKHTFAVRFLCNEDLPTSSGMMIYDLMEILGHSSLSTTERYLPAIPYGTTIEGTVWDYL